MPLLGSSWAILVFPKAWSLVPFVFCLNASILLHYPPIQRSITLLCGIRRQKSSVGCSKTLFWLKENKLEIICICFIKIVRISSNIKTAAGNLSVIFQPSHKRCLIMVPPNQVFPPLCDYCNSLYSGLKTQSHAFSWYKMHLFWPLFAGFIR